MKRENLKCSLCNKIAFYMAGDKGFCEEHKEGAIVLQKKLDRLKRARYEANDEEIKRRIDARFKYRDSSYRIGKNKW